MRKLVTIRKIRDILLVKSADNILVARIDGWNCVVHKNQGFKIGDLAVYFEVGSFLPLDPRFSFLKDASCYKKLRFENGNPDGLREEGYKLRTVTLCNVQSQGLLMPISDFDSDLKNVQLIEGTDVTKALNVMPFVKPVPECMKGLLKCEIPYGIPRTDQVRIQNLTHYFIDHRNMTFEETEKIDGRSETIYFKSGEFGVCNRNWELHESSSNYYWEKARDLDIESVLRSIDENMALQMEIAGKGINDNPLGLRNRELFLFDIYMINKRRYMLPAERSSMHDRISKKCDLKHVPVLKPSIQVLKRFTMDDTDDFIKYSQGKSMINPKKKREGLVFKSCVLVEGQTISFKVKKD